MHHLPRILAAACGLVIVVTTACSDDGGSTIAPPPPGDATYRWMNPVSEGATLSDVWGPAADNLFATGGGGIVLRYDGAAWSRTQTPVRENLNAVWGADASHAFAVGQDGVILFFNGTSWVEQASPTTSILNDVWGSSTGNVYAVGQQRELIHFDGASWSTVNVAPGIEAFQSIWGSGPTDIYVTGLDRSLLHYDGKSWSEVPTNANFALTTVWGTDSLDVFVAGGNGAVARYDGAWSNIDIGEPLYPIGLWGSATNDVYAVGFAAGASSAGFHWDGIAWSPVNMNTLKGFNGVFGVDATVVAVGSSGLVHEKSGDEFVAMPGGLTADLNAVWVSPGGSEAFAAGDFGTILHFKNGAWSAMNSGTTSRLRGLGGTCTCNLLAVGENGVVLRYDGAGWNDASPGVAVSFNEAWMDVSGTAIVVGDLGTVMRYETGTWSPMSPGSTTQELLSVWGSSPDDVYVVGRESTAFRWIGTQYKPVTIDPSTAQNFHTVNGTGADDVYVGSELMSAPPMGNPAHAGGKIHRWDGDQWTPLYFDPIHDVLSVWRHGQAGFATGDSNSLLRDPAGDDGWARVWDVEGLPFYVNSVWGSSMKNVFVVGNDGAIIRYGP